MTEPIIALDHVSRIYDMGRLQVPALSDVSLEVHPGERLDVAASHAPRRRRCAHQRRVRLFRGRRLFVQQLGDPRRKGLRSPVLVVAQPVLGDVYLAEARF